MTIFPEAHVWPYYTGIRPFGEAAFHYPVATGKPVYTMTVTYQRRRWSDVRGSPCLWMVPCGRMRP